MNLENLTTLGLIALMVVGFYFLIIRPTRNRQKEQAKTLESATPGVWVMTTTGIVGRIHRTGDRQVMIEIAPEVYMTVVRQAIMQVLPDEQANEFLDPDTMLERDPEFDDDFDADDSVDRFDTTDEPLTNDTSSVDPRATDRSTTRDSTDTAAEGSGDTDDKSTGR
ncbi:preprotein translocase subunit YajC [Naumannella halotolerans]|uniref:Preprotein translocase subunit YajC n=1 Tax=Naumannella halotolerans TaxID=993414 RepID=A0A4V3ENE9_9ACTN|nr:preprotein translocase subunit YajC [Naumannella halotolerans]TDT33508.1 preprotein translocase subunit YajC [Naumannella halotolerans]